MTYNESKATPAKVLLMGRGSAGKTSMHNIIFKRHQPNQTDCLTATLGVTPVEYKMMGNLIRLALWDCGGQAQNFEADPDRRQNVFSKVQVLVYVFEAKRWQNWQEDSDDFTNTLKSLREFSPKAKLFIVVSKMDLIKTKLERQSVNRNYGNLGQTSAEEYGFTFDSMNDLLTTTFYDYSLWKAWAKVVRYILPDINVVDEALIVTCEALRVTDGVIFDDGTLLPIAQVHFLPDDSIQPNDEIDELTEDFLYEGIVNLRTSGMAYSMFGIGSPDVLEDVLYSVADEDQWYKPFGGNTTIVLRSVYRYEEDRIPLEIFYKLLEEQKVIFARILNVHYVPSSDVEDAGAQQEEVVQANIREN